MKRLIAVVACVAMLGFLCGCETGGSSSGNDTPVMKAESTGITPALGSYAMSVDGYVYNNGYKYQKSFTVTATNMISYTSDTFSYYGMPIHDGGVSFSNGRYWWPLNGENVTMEDESGNCAPSDGFAMLFKWTTPTHCEGTAWFGDSTNGLPFTADR